MTDWLSWVPAVLGVCVLIVLFRIGRQLEAIHAAILRGQGIDLDDDSPI